MKVGYAIKTTPKRYDLARNYFENVPEGSVCYLHNDVAGLGGPSATNICIKELYDAGCDYLVLMDDDTRILRSDFADLLIRTHQVTGIHHFTLPGSSTVVLKKQFGDLTLIQSQRGSGVMLFVTRKAVETVGYLNTAYPGKWGHSHIGWSIRMLRAGLIPGFKNWRVSIEGMEKYFWSDDIHGKGADLNGAPVAQNYSEAEKAEFMRMNLAEHNRENRSGKLYYPFSVRAAGAAKPLQATPPRIHYLTPGRADKNIGRAYNEACALIPAGDWIAIQDQDSLFWPEFTLKQVEDIISQHGGDFALMGCVTNRLASKYQRPFPEDFDNMDIMHHRGRAEQLHREKYGIVTGGKKEIAGLFMLFPKSTWDKVKFVENCIFADTLFCQSVVKKVGNIGVMQGVYVYHYYRAHAPDPMRYKKHLLA